MPPCLVSCSAARMGLPLRVEVPQTGAHWESVYLPEHGSILLARGWERQLDTRDAALFYEGGPLAEGSPAGACRCHGCLPRVAVRKRDLLRGAARCAAGLLRRRRGPSDRARSALSARSVAIAALAPVRGRGRAGVGDAPRAAHGRRRRLLHARGTRVAGSYEVRVRYTPYWASNAATDACAARRAAGPRWKRTPRARSGWASTSLLRGSSVRARDAPEHPLGYLDGRSASPVSRHASYPTDRSMCSASWRFSEPPTLPTEWCGEWSRAEPPPPSSMRAS